MAKHEQENLIQDFTIPPVDPGGASPEMIKPWVEENKSKAQAEYDLLRVKKATLSHEIREVDDQMTALRSIIVNERTSGDPGKLGYGRTETPLDLPPRTFDFHPRGTFRNFRRSFFGGR